MPYLVAKRDSRVLTARGTSEPLEVFFDRIKFVPSGTRIEVGTEKYVIFAKRRHVAFEVLRDGRSTGGYLLKKEATKPLENAA